MGHRRTVQKVAIYERDIHDFIKLSEGFLRAVEAWR